MRPFLLALPLVWLLGIASGGLYAWLTPPSSEQAPTPTEAASPAPAASQEDSTAFQAFVREKSLDQRLERATALFPDTEPGHNLAQLITVLAPSAASAEGERLFAERYRRMQAAAAASIEALKAGFAAMGPDWAYERELLIQFASRLDAPAEALDALLEAEMRRPMDASFSPAIALTIYMHSALGRDLTKARPIAVKAIQHQKTKLARREMLARWKAVDPDGAAQFETWQSQRGNGTVDEFARWLQQGRGQSLPRPGTATDPDSSQ